ncbi:hypothetical protein WJ973_18005 [Achromobacter xylosoxidans]
MIDMTRLPPSRMTNRWLQLLAACLTAVLIPLCFTGPAVVLPAISHALGGTPVQLNWILNGYILAYGSVIMVSGSLTDLYGRAASGWADWRGSAPSPFRSPGRLRPPGSISCG